MCFQERNAAKQAMQNWPEQEEEEDLWLGMLCRVYWYIGLLGRERRDEGVPEIL